MNKIKDKTVCKWECHLRLNYEITILPGKSYNSFIKHIMIYLVCSSKFFKYQQIFHALMNFICTNVTPPNWVKHILQFYSKSYRLLNTSNTLSCTFYLNCLKLTVLRITKKSISYAKIFNLILCDSLYISSDILLFFSLE